MALGADENEAACRRGPRDKAYARLSVAQKLAVPSCKIRLNCVFCLIEREGVIGATHLRAIA
jgi:hypothetical protein